MRMPLKEIRVNLNYRNLLMPLCIKWKRTKVMNQVKKFLKVLKNLLCHLTTKISLKPCLIIIESYSDLRTSSKCWSRRPRQEVYPFHKCFHQKRRSYTRKQRKWLTNIVGSSLFIRVSVPKIQTIAIHSCSTSPEFFLIRNMIDSSTRP